MLSSAPREHPRTNTFRARRLHPRDRRRRPARGPGHESVVTRFPPEPNGYLHIGHAKSICLNFGIAGEFGGRCHLRFDDTNPMKEEQEYIDSIEADVRWLGFDWGEHLYFASDYFEQLYEWAVALIEAGKAYVDDLSADEIREHRGTFTEPGTDSPWRDRPVAENLDLFARMRAGEFPDGARVLRARIDMAAPNINLRDPVLYRILHAEHPRTGDAWCVYPTYDFAHGQSDAIEGITHSICTLEFEAHRPLYDWLIQNLPVPAVPHQYEFARLNLTHTVLSKRVLLRLVNEGFVRGWDDPRMPTMSALRRRGFPAEGVRDFATLVGVAKADNTVEVEMLEHAVRGVLNREALRRFAVLDPLKVVIENYPEGQTEEMEVPNNPEDPSAGTRKVAFSRELWIERDDFMEEPVRKFFRLAPGREVRLRSAYFVTCDEVVKDAAGEHRRAALQLRPGDARRRRVPTAAAPRPRSTGCRPRTRCRRRSGSTAISSAARTPGPTAATSSRTSTRTPRPCCAAASWSRRSPTCPSARPSSSSGSATSARTPTRRRARSCSTAPSRSRTPGPSCRSRDGKTGLEPPARGAGLTASAGAAKRPLKRDSSRRRRLSEPPPRGRLSTSLASGLIGKAPDSGSGD